jgi:hypothetical protein
MPELPFQRRNFLVDGREDPAKDRRRAEHMVGDLLHGPDLHRQVEPVDNIRRWFWRRPWQALHDSGAIRENRDLSMPGISLELKSLKRPRPHFTQRGVASSRNNDWAASLVRRDRGARRRFQSRSMSSGVARSRQISPRTVKAMEKWESNAGKPSSAGFSQQRFQTPCEFSASCRP